MRGASRLKIHTAKMQVQTKMIAPGIRDQVEWFLWAVYRRNR